jgi:NADPH:quinone reductase-like Zn-dependent oxidoreductase
MKRAQYSERSPDPQASIEAVEFTLPELSAGQALLEVLAAPINPSDVLTLTGLYGMLPPLPAVGGNEGVGKVIALGPDTKGPAVGQTVLLPVGCGTWSTHVQVDAKTLMPLPNDADPLQLAMMTVNPPTASLMLSEFVDLEAGEWVIQNAANSGVGAYLIQLAKARGFKTVNIVRRESAVAGVRETGGDVVLVDGPGLAKRVAEATGGAKIRLGIDAVGGTSTDNLANCLTDGGVLVNYGMMSGQACQVSPASFVFRDVTLRGFWLAQWFRKAAPEKRMAVFGEIARLIAAGKLKSSVQATYSIDQIKEAVGAAAAGERDGKILIVPNG